MSTYKVVKLLQNRLYPTYQLYAQMANKKTSPQDGLRLAALITMDWVRKRLGENIPKELQQIPEPSAYRDTSNEQLTSLHINSGFVMDIVALPEQGSWTLLITEPDLGSDPGNPAQQRQAVAGRVIETNIAFQITGTKLECGFQTVISDPEGTAELADVYRLAIIRQLIAHPDFGLHQFTPLTHDYSRITTVEQLNQLQAVSKEISNSLPCVIFTQIKEAATLPVPDMTTLAMPPRYTFPLSKPTPPEGIPKVKQVKDPPYDIASFARSCVTYCRVYLLEDALLDRFCRMFSSSVTAGEIIVIEPLCFGRRIRTIPYKPGKSRQTQVLVALRKDMFHYLREKTICFGNIAFLSAARENLLHNTADALIHSQNVDVKWTQRVTRLKTNWKAELNRKDAEIQALNDKLKRQNEYGFQLEQEMAQLRQTMEHEQYRFKEQLAKREAYIAYLKRKLQQPKEHSKIPEWIESNFSGRLCLHPKAAALITDKAARSVNLELICDALDFLATDYRDQRYRYITKDEMQSRCSEKYGRPFTIAPVGSTTIEAFPLQYKVEYRFMEMKDSVLTPLDCHLRVGNVPENLLRIYFFHDDDRQQIVVGSLPHHLPSVTIK